MYMGILIWDIFTVTVDNAYKFRTSPRRQQHDKYPFPISECSLKIHQHKLDELL
jgi:hypothetical protein